MINYEVVSELLATGRAKDALVVCDWLEDHGLPAMSRRIRYVAAHWDPRSGLKFWAEFFKYRGEWFDVDRLAAVHIQESGFVDALREARELGMMWPTPREGTAPGEV